MVDEVRYERNGAAAVLTIDRQERRNAVDGPTAEACSRASTRFEADDEARVLVVTGAGGVRFCAGADLKAIDDASRRASTPERAVRLHAPDARRSRRSRRSPAGAWPAGSSSRCGATCGSPPRTRKLGFPERRWGVPLIDGGTQRLPRIVGLGRALDLILSGRIVEADEALAIGLVTEVVARGPAARARARDRRGARRVPAGDDARRPPRSDRGRSACRSTDGLALEAQAGPQVFADAVAGAARFAGGEGRGGAGAGV